MLPPKSILPSSSTRTLRNYRARTYQAESGKHMLRCKPRKLTSLIGPYSTSSPLTFSAPPVLPPLLKIVELRLMLTSMTSQPPVSVIIIQEIDQCICNILYRCADFWLVSDKSDVLLVHENAFVEDIQALIMIRDKLWATNFARKSAITDLLNSMLELLLKCLQNTG